jgi:hypothetical protein
MVEGVYRWERFQADIKWGMPVKLKAAVESQISPRFAALWSRQT